MFNWLKPLIACVHLCPSNKCICRQICDKILAIDRLQTILSNVHINMVTSKMGQKCLV